MMMAEEIFSKGTAQMPLYLSSRLRIDMWSREQLCLANKPELKMSLLKSLLVPIQKLLG
jgi:hypothetical protein